MEPSRNKKSLKIVFFGLGSIGTRLAALVKDYFPHELWALRSGTGPPNTLGVAEIHDLQEIEGLRPDIGFITNPTSLHMETALFCADMGMDMFIEKPLTHSLDGMERLPALIKEKGVISYVACNLRFDPVIAYLKERLEHERPICSRAICSSYLPEWRPGRDYTKAYSGRKNLGGGVILDLVHEPDYCQWLFGPVIRITGLAGNYSSLSIETEDFAALTVEHASGAVSQLHLDYFGCNTQRRLEILGNGFYIEADLVKKVVVEVSKGGRSEKSFPPLTRNDSYLNELNYFFNCIYDSKTPMNNVEEHVSLLKPILAFKQSLSLTDEARNLGSDASKRKCEVTS